MKSKGIFISAILIVDTFLVSYAIGFNSRHVAVVDPTMKPVAAPQEVKLDKNLPAVMPVAAKKTEKTEHKTKAKVHKKRSKAKKPPAVK
jgi:regulatory protein YycI of two-component signal transduction system YycFG